MRRTPVFAPARDKGPRSNWQSDCHSHGVVERSIYMRTLLLAALIGAPLLAESNEPAKRLEESAVVFSASKNTPEKGIPSDLIEKAHGIVTVPGMKNGGLP